MSARVQIAAACLMAASMMTVHASPPAEAARPPATAPHAVTVAIKEFMFEPRTITIAPGSTVTWRNLDPEPHTVRGADELIRSGALDQDETYSVKFDKPGTYRYGCSIHPQMAATIVVQ